MAMPDGEALIKMGFENANQMIMTPWLIEDEIVEGNAPVIKLGSSLWKNGDLSSPKDTVAIEIVGAPLQEGKLNYGLLTSVELRGSDYLPGSQVLFYLYSEPTAMGSAVVDENGQFQTNLSIGMDDPLRDHSDHTLRIFGYSSNNVMWVLAAPVTLDKAAPVVPGPGSSDNESPAGSQQSPLVTTGFMSAKPEGLSYGLQQIVDLDSGEVLLYNPSGGWVPRTLPFTADSIERRLQLSSLGTPSNTARQSVSSWLLQLLALGFLFLLMFRRRKDVEFDLEPGWNNPRP
jgi:hypothetical protein